MSVFEQIMLPIHQYDVTHYVTYDVITNFSRRSEKFLVSQRIGVATFKLEPFFFLLFFFVLFFYFSFFFGGKKYYLITDNMANLCTHFVATFAFQPRSGGVSKCSE